MEGGGKGLFDPYARRHWMKHYYTESVWYSTEEAEGQPRTVKINVDLRGPDKIHQRHIERQITERMQLHLEGLPFSQFGFTLEIGQIKHHPINPELTSSVLLKKDVRILYVDDDKLTGQSVKKLLERDGVVHCHLALDSISATQFLFQSTQEQNNTYHLIILDLAMPDLNGVYSLRAGADLIPASQRLCPEAQIIIFSISSEERDKDTSEIIKEVEKSGAKVVRKDKGVRILTQEIWNGLELRYFVEDEGPELEEAIMEKYIPEIYSILVVDDDDIWAEQCIKALKKAGFDADRATGADKAVVKLKKKRYHGAVLDKNMKGLDGKQDDDAGIKLYEQHILEKHPDISCLLLTAEPTYHSHRDAEKLGMFAYHDKIEIGHREVAQLVNDMFQTRLVTVYHAGGTPVRADRMYFFGKKGIITKETSSDVNPEYAGVVEIDGEKWIATTKGLSGVPLYPGSEVIARGVLSGAIQVQSEHF